MPFDPNAPATNSPILSAELRGQFNSLKALIDAIPAGPAGPAGPQGPAGPSIGAIPIGGVAAWMKSFANTPPLPAEFAECNGQVLNDPLSPYDGATIPDLNGEGRFLCGSSVSGPTGGAAGHSHGYNSSVSVDGGGAYSVAENGTGTTTVDHLPPFYEVVWIMRVR
jgi:hypothetical protein